MTTLGVVLVAGLAAARVVRLWRDDIIAEGLRTRMEAFGSRPGRLAGLRGWVLTLTECPWCLSAWVSAGFIVAADSATSRSIDIPFLSWLAAWYVACFAYWLAELVADKDSLAWHDRESKGIS